MAVMNRTMVADQQLYDFTELQNEYVKRCVAAEVLPEQAVMSSLKDNHLSVDLDW